MISTDIAIWIQAVLILMWLSQLYKQNIFYRFTEYTFIGVAVGHSTVLVYKNVVSMVYTPIVFKADFLLIIPVILGLLIWTRLSPKYGWVSRWPMAVIVGVSAAIAVRGAIKTQIYDQIIATIQLGVVRPDILSNVNNFLIVVTAICTLTYFVYFKEHKGALGTAAKIGRITMMATFGNTIAWAFAGRLNPLIALLQTLLLDWLHLR